MSVLAPSLIPPDNPEISTLPASPAKKSNSLLNLSFSRLKTPEKSKCQDQTDLPPSPETPRKPTDQMEFLLACQKCDISKIQILLEENDDLLFSRDNEGKHALFYIFSRKTYKWSSKFPVNPMMETMLSLDFKSLLPVKDEQGQTIFEYTAARGHWQALGLMLVTETEQRSSTLSSKNIIQCHQVIFLLFSESFLC